jgi:uncharacterized protein (DUF302 family)
MTSCYYSKQFEQSFEEVLIELIKAFEREGFSIVSRIDVQNLLSEKLGFGFRRYVIFGVICPSLACRALLTENEIGSVIPCNIIVREKAEGVIEVSAVDHTDFMVEAKNLELDQINTQLRMLVKNVISSR